MTLLARIRLSEQSDTLLAKLSVGKGLQANCDEL